MKLQKKMLVATIALALAGLTGSAFAGTVSSTFNTYATEAVSGLTAVNSPVMAYQPGKLIAAGTSFTIYIQLNGGAKWLAAATGAVSSTTVSFGSAVLGTSFVSASGTVLALNFTAGASAIPTSTVLNMSALSASIDLSGATGLVSSGGIVTATFALANGTAGSTPVFPTAPLDMASGTVANSLQAITATVVSSATFTPIAESAKIDVQASTGPLSNTLVGLAAAGTVNFGSVSFTTTPGTQLNGSGADFGFADLTGGVSFAVNGTFLPNANYTFAIDSNTACTSGVSGAASSLNTTTGNVVVTINSTALGTGPYYICGSVVSGNSTAIPATTPSITSVKQLIGSTVAATDPGGTLYPLTANGSSVTLAYYVPSNAAPGYATYIRIWNNSGLPVAVKGTMTSQAGVQLGTTQTVAIIPARGAVILNGKTIETALGVTLAASARPTLGLSGTVPASSLVVQAYQGNPNGTVTNFTATKN